MGGSGVDLPTLMGYLEQAIGEFPDSRTGSNTRYTIRDAALAAFSVFFTQSPSFLAHQRSMQLSKGKSNADTIFGVNEIPTDNHIRSLLDPVDVSLVQPVFRKVFEGLHEREALDCGVSTEHFLSRLTGYGFTTPSRCTANTAIPNSTAMDGRPIITARSPRCSSLLGTVG
jgi:hypothetical protein